MTQPPVAKRVDHRREHHGDVFIDPYEWLREKDSPEVISYLEAENAYTDAQTEVLAPLRQGNKAGAQALATRLLPFGWLDAK